MRKCFIKLKGKFYSFFGFRSQYGQDRWLYNTYFKSKKDKGFFLEIGADDGKDKSNSFFFEHKLGWNGICIEPSPIRFKLLRKNRKCICENIAISDKEGEGEFLDISGWGKGLSGIVENYNKKHKMRIAQELKNTKNKGKEVIKVKMEKLQTTLERHNVKKVDFCTIDTEGSEKNILNSIDFDKVIIDIILVENNYNDTDIKDFLTDKGYKFIKTVGIDDVYKKI